LYQNREVNNEEAACIRNEMQHRHWGYLVKCCLAESMLSVGGHLENVIFVFGTFDTNQGYNIRGLVSTTMSNKPML